MELETKQLVMAVKAIAEEKNLPEDVVQDAIQQALAAAWRPRIDRRRRSAVYPARPPQR